MKILRRIIIILVLLLILAFTGIVMFTEVLGGPYINLPVLNISSTQTTSSHDALLEEMRTVSELQSVEYIYKLVFPHDFFIDDMSYAELMERSESGGPEIQDALTPEEFRYYEAYNLARNSGLAPLSGNYDFIVITARIDLGYQLQEANLNELAEIVEGEDGQPQQIIFSLPPAQVLNIRIEDPDSSNYHYPDLVLDQQNWSRISGFVRSHIEELAELESMKIEARNSLLGFFSTFIEQGGLQGMNIPVEFRSMQ